MYTVSSTFLMKVELKEGKRGQLSHIHLAATLGAIHLKCIAGGNFIKANSNYDPLLHKLR
jgi:hypothetical protein